jgi:hypothetical protein
MRAESSFFDDDKDDDAGISSPVGVTKLNFRAQANLRVHLFLIQFSRTAIERIGGSAISVHKKSTRDNLTSIGLNSPVIINE